MGWSLLTSKSLFSREFVCAMAAFLARTPGGTDANIRLLPGKLPSLKDVAGEMDNVAMTGRWLGEDWMPGPAGVRATPTGALSKFGSWVACTSVVYVMVCSDSLEGLGVLGGAVIPVRLPGTIR